MSSGAPLRGRTASAPTAGRQPATRRRGLLTRLLGLRTSARPLDADLVGAAVVCGGTVVGHVLRLLLDPISGRVWRLVIQYRAGPGSDRCVAVPIHWVHAQQAGRVVLAADTMSLDALSDSDPQPLTYRDGPKAGVRA